MFLQESFFFYSETERGLKEQSLVIFSKVTPKIDDDVQTPTVVAFFPQKNRPNISCILKAFFSWDSYFKMLVYVIDRFDWQMEPPEQQFFP